MLRPSFVLLAVLAALIGLGSVAGGIGVVGVAGILLVGVIVIFAHKRILLSWDLRIVSAGRKKLCMQEKGVEKLGCIHYNISRENAMEKFKKSFKKVLTRGGSIAIIIEQNKEG